MNGHEPTPDALLRHAGFVRAIARGLLAPDEAEDVVQDTMLAALRQPPRDASRLRAWLGAVGRRVSLKTLRSNRRRDSRERGAARPEALPSAAEVAGQLEIQRRVVDAVVRLDEPYRSTIVHRFFHDRSVEEIAKGLGVPRKTVESRLTRALAQLRARLDAEHGGRRAWTVALLPFAWPRPSAAAFGGLVMTAKTKTALAAGLLVATAVGVWATRHWTRPEPTDRASQTRDALPVASVAEETDGPPAAIAASPPDAQPSAPVVAIAVPAGTILGQILVPEGHPARGARVEVWTWRRREDVITPVRVAFATDVDDEGSYRFEGLVPGDYVAKAECEGYAPETSECLVIDDKGGARWSATLRRGGTLGVVVRDTAGAPLVDVEIEAAGGRRARTDGAGQVVFDHVVAGVYVVDVRLADDDESRIAKIEDGVTTTVMVVTGTTLRGSVTLEDGPPVCGAQMWAALDLPGGGACFAMESTDASGRYEFRWLGPGDWKVRMGNMGVSSEPRSVRIGDDPLASLDLKLMRPSIAGRLVSSRAGFSPAMVNLFPGEDPRAEIRGIAVALDGSFVFHDLAPGEYVISVQPGKSGYAQREVRVGVAAGQRFEGLEIPIEEIRYGDVELEISDGEGAVTETVQMFVSDPEGWKFRRSTSMAPAPVSPGRFKLTLECGRRVVTVRGKNGNVKVDVDIEEGKTVFKSVRLR